MEERLLYITLTLLLIVTWVMSHPAEEECPVVQGMDCNDTGSAATILLRAESQEANLWVGIFYAK